MELSLDSFRSEIGRTKHGLAFHADGAALIIAFSDELAAYRARKVWTETFRNYFLLERDRDYEIWVSQTAQEDDCFVLSACFVSACGRYAFWRLINQQCPEVEKRLMGIRLPTKEQNSSAEHEGPWVLSDATSRRARKGSWEICRDALDRFIKKVL